VFISFIWFVLRSVYLAVFLVASRLPFLNKLEYNHFNVSFVETGQVPFNMMGLSSSSSSANVPGVSNCLSVEQLQLMSHLAQQQQHQQPRPVYPSLEAMLGHGQLLAGYMQQPPPPLSVNNATVRPQPQLRGTTELIQPTVVYYYMYSFFSG